MGGRGGAGSAAQKVNSPRKTGSIKELVSNMKALDNYGSEKIQSDDLKKKLPTYGDKVQTAYIDYVKQQTGVDLGKARDTYFDNRKGFNIDTSKLNPSELATVKRLAQTYPAGYEVRFSPNGATRLYIAVERKKKK